MHMIGCRGRRFSVSAETKPGTVMPHGTCHELPPKPPICRDHRSGIPHSASQNDANPIPATHASCSPAPLQKQNTCTQKVRIREQRAQKNLKP